MMAELKPYPMTKDSGVPWLGKVPDHWQPLPAVAVYKPRQVKNTGMIEKTVLSLSYGRIVIKPPEKLRGLVPESFETYQIVDPGNIVVRTTDLQTIIPAYELAIRLIEVSSLRRICASRRGLASQTSSVISF